MQSDYERNQESHTGRGAGRQHDEDRWSQRQSNAPDDYRSGRGRRQSGREQPSSFEQERGDSGGQWGRSQAPDDRYQGRYEGGGREYRDRGGNDEFGNYGSEYIDRGPGSRNHEAGRYGHRPQFEERFPGSNTNLGSGYRDLGGSFESPEQRRSSQGGGRGFRGKAPKGYKRSDDAICEEVCQRLEDADVDPSEVSVSVKDGNVTLKGSTDSRWDKRTIEDTAYSARGVKDVHNLLQIQSDRSSDESSGDESSGDGQPKSNWRSSGNSEQNQQQPRMG